MAWAGALALFPLGAYCEDKVSGTLTAKDQSSELRYVYAFWKPNMLDESKWDLRVLLTDVPVAPDTLPRNDDGIAKMAALVRENKIHAVELHFDGATKQLFAAEEAAVYHLAIAMARHGWNGGVQFSETRNDGTTRAGKLTTNKDSDEYRGWSCSASFEVAVPPKP
jgi:hypothetical protein